MFTNYLKIAWCNLWKNKAFPLAYILGPGPAFAMTAYLELSFDRFQGNQGLANQHLHPDESPQRTGAPRTLEAAMFHPGESLKSK